MTQDANKNIEWYLSSFEAFERGLNGESRLPIHVMRKTAMAKFAELGFPTTKHEEWRFTNITPIVRTRFTPATKSLARKVTSKDLGSFTFAGLNFHQLVFLNGHYSSELSAIGSLPKTVRVGSLADAVNADGDLMYAHLGKYVRGDENAFTALNTGFMQDGAFIFVPDGIALNEPVHLLFLSTGKDSSFISTPRNLIVVGKNSQISIIESYVSFAGVPYLTNAVTEMVIGESAVVEHDKFQDESLNAFHVGTTHFQQGAGSTVVSNSIALGGSVVRNNVTGVLGSEGVECTLNGLSIATGQQLVDNHTTIDHAFPNCTSHELYKAVLDGKSRGVFNGKIFVRKDAQKTDAKQTNKTLLLSDEATIDTKPQLEIFADDVKCTHGATVGQLDEEQIFYLRSRGLELEAARDLLTFAFASDVVNRIHVESLRNQLDTIIQDRLRKGRGLIA